MGTAPLTAYLDEEALNALLQLLFTADDASDKKLSTKLINWGGLSHEIKIYPLRTVLGPQGAPPSTQNVRITTRVTVFKIPFVAWLFARITSQQGYIVITDLGLEIPSREDIVEQLDKYSGAKQTGGPSLADFVNVLLRMLQPELAKLPPIKIPLQVQDLYHSDLSATLKSADVVSVRGVWVVCAIVEMYHQTSASRALTPLPLPRGLVAPPQARSLEETPDPNEAPRQGNIDLIVSEAAFNLIAGEELIGKTQAINTSERVLGVKVGIKSDAKLDKLDITIPSSVGLAKARLRFKKTNAGVSVSRLWAGATIELKSARADVTIELSSDAGGREGYLDFKKFKKLKVRLESRHPFDLGTPLLNEIIDDVVKPELNKWLKNKDWRMPLLVLPDTLPGTNIPVVLEYREDGLQFHPGMALFEISIDPPPLPSPADERSSWEIRYTMQSGASTILLDAFASGGMPIRAELTVESPGNGTYSVLISDLLNGNQRVFLSDPNTGLLPDQPYAFTYQSAALSLLLLQVNWSLNGDEVLHLVIKLTRRPGAQA